MNFYDQRVFVTLGVLRSQATFQCGIYAPAQISPTTFRGKTNPNITLFRRPHIDRALLYKEVSLNPSEIVQKKITFLGLYRNMGSGIAN